MFRHTRHIYGLLKSIQHSEDMNHRVNDNVLGQHNPCVNKDWYGFKACAHPLLLADSLYLAQRIESVARGQLLKRQIDPELEELSGLEDTLFSHHFPLVN